MIFDTHCHGYWNGLEQRQGGVRRNMRAQGVTRSVQIGTGLEMSRKALTLSRAWGPETWCTAGLHPTGCRDMPESSVRQFTVQLEELIQANRDKMVAVGETGLDYYHLTRGNEAKQKQTQRLFFAAQAALALRLDLPLVIHTRAAAAETIALLREYEVRRAVIHCFSENPDFARALMTWSDEIYFSVSGILTYRGSVSVQETAKILPLERILVETDAPFLVPQVLCDAHTPNEPAFARHVMDFLKTLRREPGHVVEEAVWGNSNRFFRIEN